MIRNYLLLTFRNLIKNKVYTIINVFGLTVGFSSVILILLYVQDEIGYDKYHPDTEHIYRIYWQSGNPQTRTPHPMAQALVADFPEVESAVSLSPIWGAGLTKRTFSVRNLEKDIRYNEKDVLTVDSTFFEVFPLPLIQGNREKVLHTPGRMLLSRSAAEKYFGTEDPIGKYLAVDDDENLIEVEGVFEDFPRQSHFHPMALVSYVHMKKNEDEESAFYTWSDFGHYNYIKLAPGADPQKLEGQLLPWAAKYINATDEQMRSVMENKEGFKLQHIRDIHLKSHLLWELEANGNMEYIYIMTAAAFLILIIAGINFMNLTTAKSAERAKEIGIRRTLGAVKKQLSLQFIGESLLVASFSMILAGLIAEVTLPLFNQLSGKALEADLLRNPLTLLLILGIGLLTGVLSGLYPSMVLSSLNPALVLKGKFTRSKSGNNLARVLVIFQFAMAIMLISGTAIILDQMNFIRDKNLGFAQEGTLLIPLRQQEMRRDFETIQTELLNVPGIKSVGAASNVPGTQFNVNPIYPANDTQLEVNVAQMYVDYDLIKTLDLEVIQGRAFDRSFPSDTAHAFIVNEAAARELQYAEPVGKEIVLIDDEVEYRGMIVGLIKDFNYQSLHQPIRPLILQRRPYYNTVVVKLNSDDVAQTIAAVEKVWEKFDDSFGFDFSFLEETIQLQYTAENKMGVVFGLFAGIAIIISCMGLFGLASMNFAQRKKEVSIRKVLGASLPSLLVSLLKDYSKLILIAIALAIPVAWWVMNDWMDQFVFKVGVNVWTFLIIGFCTLVMAWLTIGYLTVQTASLNPADTLKEE